jgi:hypothetical protein
MGLPDSTGMFSELFTNLQNEIKRDRKVATDYGKSENMTDEEKRISFMNRYFVFKKVRNVNTDKIAKIIEQQTKMAENIEEVIEKDIEEMERKEEISRATIELPKPLVRKIKKPKIALEKYSIEDSAPEPVVQEAPKKLTIKKPVLKITVQP